MVGTFLSTGLRASGPFISSSDVKINCDANLSSGTSYLRGLEKVELINWLVKTISLFLDELSGSGETGKLLAATRKLNLYEILQR